MIHPTPSSSALLLSHDVLMCHRLYHLLYTLPSWHAIRTGVCNMLNYSFFPTRYRPNYDADAATEHMDYYSTRVATPLILQAVSTAATNPPTPHLLPHHSSIWAHDYEVN
jgi:hypothetical protein